MADDSKWNALFGNETKFAKFMNKLFDVLYTGILWILLTIPIVTAGAAFSAAYYTMVKCVKHSAGYVTREFFGCFKRNFKQSLPMTLLFLLAAAVVALDIWYLWTNDSKTNSSLFIVMLLVAFVVIGLATYVFPLLSRFDQKNTRLILTSLVVMFRHLPFTILLLLWDVVAVVVVYLMPWMIFFMPGVYLFVFTIPVEKVMRRLMPPVEEDSEEAQKWYYQ